VRPDSRNTSVQTCSVLRSTCETNFAPASFAGGAGAGPCCWTTWPPSLPPIMPSSVSGLMPKIQPAMTATARPAEADAATADAESAAPATAHAANVLDVAALVLAVHAHVDLPTSILERC
jgi:hypothetical protein